MTDEQEIKIKVTAETASAEVRLERTADATERIDEASSSASRGVKKAGNSIARAGQQAGTASQRTSGFSSILSSISPRFGQLSEKAESAFGQMESGFRSTGKGATMMKVAGVAAIAAVASEVVKAGVQMAQAVWNYAKEAFKAFNPVEYSKTFGNLNRSIKRFKTALGGLVEGPVKSLVYMATGLLNTLTQIILKFYEAQQEIGLWDKFTSWLGDLVGISDDVTESLDGTVAAFDRLNILGQDTGDADLRDEMNGVDEDAEEWQKKLDKVRMDWDTFFADSPTVSKELLETLISISLPDLDWDRFFGDSDVISTELLETVMRISVPDQNWDGFFGDAPEITKDLAADILNVRLPVLDWDVLFSGGLTLSREMATSLMNLILPIPDWEVFFADGQIMSKEIAARLFSLGVPEIDWDGFFGDSETVSHDVAQTLLELYIPDLDWDGFFDDSPEVSTDLAKTLLGLVIPDKDWDEYFGDAPTVSKDMLADILASEYPEQDWTGFFDNSQEVSKSILENILDSVYPGQDWASFFGNAETISADIAANFMKMTVPEIEWDEIFGTDEDRTVRITIIKEIKTLGGSSSDGFFSNSDKTPETDDEKTSSKAEVKGANPIKETIDNIVDIVDGLGDAVINGADADNLGKVVDALTENVFIDIEPTSGLSGAVNDFVDDVVAAGTSIVVGAGEAWDSLKEGVADVGGAVIDAVADTAKKVADGIGNAFGKIGGFFHLASGGAVAPNNPQPYILGDNRRDYEVISPVPLMKETFKAALNEMLSQGKINGSGSIELTINLNGKRIAREIYDDLQTESRRRGTTI